MTLPTAGGYTGRMKRIVCFGDSNTWGYVPGAAGLCRYDEDVRWTGIVQERLGTRARILEFGLCGCESGLKRRNKCFNANAQELFPSVLFAQLPVDIVVLMLGTNDLKAANGWQPGDTAKNLRSLLAATRTLSPATATVLATPVILRDGIESDAEFTRDAIAQSRRCAQEVADLARAEHIPLFDTNAVVHELGADGCHFTPDAHRAFAAGMAELLRGMIGA